MGFKQLIRHVSREDEEEGEANRSAFQMKYIGSSKERSGGVTVHFKRWARVTHGELLWWSQPMGDKRRSDCE